MDWIRFSLALALLAFSAPALAERVGVVVDYGNGTVESRCAFFSPGDSAEGALLSAGFPAEIASYVFGDALCGIGAVGCPASDCFCSASWWSYSYESGGSWKSSNVGIGSPDDNGFPVLRDGSLIGFKWTSAWGDAPSSMSFAEACPPPQAARKAQGGEKTQKLSVTAEETGCGETVVTVKNDDGKPVAFAEVRAVRRVAGPLKYGSIVSAESDWDGKARFTLEPGYYLVQAIQQWSVPGEKEILISGCAETNPQQEAPQDREDARQAPEQEEPQERVLAATEAAGALASMLPQAATGWLLTGWGATGWEGAAQRR
jgi:hypothetical protein